MVQSNRVIGPGGRAVTAGVSLVTPTTYAVFLYVKTEVAITVRTSVFRRRLATYRQAVGSTAAV